MPDMSQMWIDTDAAEPRIAALAKKQPHLAKRLREFRRDGFVILENAVPIADIDAYVAAFDDAAAHDDSIKVSYGRDIFPIVEQDLRRPLVKILDTHVKLAQSFPLAFAAPVAEFIRTIFEEELLAFQSLHFEVGSTQAVHQDTAYVVLDRPRFLVAAWIALEDIKAGSGELIYYPGSHRFPEYLYPGGRKHWDPSTDGNAPHGEHMKGLHDKAKANGVAQSGFLARKGDVLIWHADLAHGGSQITDDKATRRSLVVHYAPASATPHYFQFVEPHMRRKTAAGPHFLSSYYYEIDDLLFPAPPEAPGLFARIKSRLGL